MFNFILIGIVKFVLCDERQQSGLRVFNTFGFEFVNIYIFSWHSSLSRNHDNIIATE